jgi:CRP-like cAMP-binding protein
MAEYGLSNSEIEELKSNISKLMPMPEAHAEVFLQGMQIRTFEKGELIIEAGKTERYLSIVISGLTRHYVIKDGEDISFDFSFKDEFNSSYASFVQKKPSQFYIEALQPTVLASFSYEFLHELYEKYPASNRFGRVAVEEYFVLREKRELSLLTENATERYKNLLQQQPIYIKQIPLKYLATYLNIKPESLSRIRKQV